MQDFVVIEIQFSDIGSYVVGNMAEGTVLQKHGWCLHKWWNIQNCEGKRYTNFHSKVYHEDPSSQFGSIWNLKNCAYLGMLIVRGTCNDAHAHWCLHSG